MVKHMKVFDTLYILHFDNSSGIVKIQGEIKEINAVQFKSYCWSIILVSEPRIHLSFFCFRVFHQWITSSRNLCLFFLIDIIHSYISQKYPALLFIADFLHKIHRKVIESQVSIMEFI